jgi:hypothetical protein
MGMVCDVCHNAPHGYMTPPDAMLCGRCYLMRCRAAAAAPSSNATRAALCGLFALCLQPCVSTVPRSTLTAHQQDADQPLGFAVYADVGVEFELKTPCPDGHQWCGAGSLLLLARCLLRQVAAESQLGKN